MQKKFRKIINLEITTCACPNVHIELCPNRDNSLQNLYAMTLLAVHIVMLDLADDSQELRFQMQ